MIFNENALRKIIKDKVKEEFKKNYDGELEKIWKYLNQFHERIKVIEGKIKNSKSLI